MTFHEIVWELSGAVFAGSLFTLSLGYLRSYFVYCAFPELNSSADVGMHGRWLKWEAVLGFVSFCAVFLYRIWFRDPPWNPSLELGLLIVCLGSVADAVFYAVFKATPGQFANFCRLFPRACRGLPEL